MKNIDYIVVGLGNPGSKYENTRHNAGFIAIDYIARKINCDINVNKFKGLCGICEIKNKKILMIKPQTYMNLSGQSVFEAMTFYKIPSDRIIVLFDDISLPVGKLRIRKEGSHGGQNGVKNIIELIDTNKFSRIKIGVGNKPNEKWNLTDWVLSKFSKEEIKNLESVLHNSYLALKLMLESNTEKAMNLYN